MGGIIVVDFIDMAKPEHRQQLYDHMREIMANDRARHNILPLSKFGLMQITRQRVRPVLDIHVSEKCPSCLGKGEVQPSILFTDTLREKLEYIVENLGVRDFIMYVHPYVDAYIKKGFFTNLYSKWRRALGRSFKILPDESLAYLQYRVVDKNRNEINLIDEKDSGESSKTKKDTKARKRGGDDNDTTTAEQPKPEQPKTEQPKTVKQQKPQQPKKKTQEQTEKKTESSEKNEKTDKVAKTTNTEKPTKQQDEPMAEQAPDVAETPQDKPVLPAIAPDLLDIVIDSDIDPDSDTDDDIDIDADNDNSRNRSQDKNLDDAAVVNPGLRATISRKTKNSVNQNPTKPRPAGAFCSPRHAATQCCLLKG